MREALSSWCFVLAGVLVQQQDGEYFYRGRVLRYWVAALIRGIEIDIDAPRSSLTPLLAELEAQQAHLSTELGHAQESRIRELLRSFSAQSIDGALFGLEGILVLPSFSPPGAVTAYRSLTVRPNLTRLPWQRMVCAGLSR